jgi:hypothetical protein
MKLATTRAWGIALASICASILGLCRVARAEPPSSHATPIYVLSVWTNDSDDQAEALSQQLRSRVRQVAGWSLLETTQSFETLAIALRCPPTPNQSCLDRIGEHLHTDHYVWGTMAKEKAGEVSADIRLWSRGKPSIEASETYSDNLKDPSDDTLRAIAGKLVAKVLGSTPTGVLVVHAGTGKGAVLVDGASKGQLDEGSARLNVPVGQHTVSVRLSGFEAEGKTVAIVEGTEEEVTVPLSAVSHEPSEAPAQEAEPEPAEHRGSAFPLRKALMVTAFVAGGLFLAGAIIEGVVWENDRSGSNNDRANIPASVTDVCNVPMPMSQTAMVLSAAQDACSKNSNATGASTGAWIFGGVGLGLVATGVVLLVTEPSHAAPTEPAQASARPRVTRPSVDVVPTFGPHVSGLGLRVSF